MIPYDFEVDEARAEHNGDDTLATVDAWSLNDFDDLLYSGRRSAAYPIGDEMLAYPS